MNLEIIPFDEFYNSLVEGNTQAQAVQKEAARCINEFVKWQKELLSNPSAEINTYFRITLNKDNIYFNGATNLFMKVLNQHLNRTGWRTTLYIWDNIYHLRFGPST